jgi:hypothetical protein
MTISCCNRYVVDAFQTEASEADARYWLGITPDCGGRLLGHFMPCEHLFILSGEQSCLRPVGAAA